MKKIEEKNIIEFLTKDGVEIKMLKRNNKYTIFVSDKNKNIKEKKVFESLNNEDSFKQFFQISSYFTKELN